MTFLEMAYVLPRFFSESNAVIKQNALTGCENIWREKIYNESYEPVFRLAIPSKPVDDLTNILISMEESVKAALDKMKYFHQTTGSCRYKVQFSDTKEVKNIKIAYIQEFLNRITEECKSIVRDPNSAHDFIKNYEEPVYFRKLKISVVDTTIPYYMTPRDMIQLDTSHTFVGNDSAVHSQILPFLLEFYNVRLHGSDDIDNPVSGFKNGSFKEISKELKKVFEKLRKGYEVLYKATLSASEQESHALIRQYFYAVFTITLQLEKYVFGCYLRLLTSYVKNMNEVQKFISFLDWKTGDPKSVVESVEDEIPDVKEWSILNPYVLLERASDLKNLIYPYVPHEEITMDYDRHAYVFPHPKCKWFADKLRTLIQNYASPDMLDTPLSDFITDSDFFKKDSLEKVFDVSRASKMHFLETVEFRPEFIVADLTAFEKNIPTTGKYIKNCIDLCARIASIIETNVNNKFPNVIRNKECHHFLMELIERLEIYGKDLHEAYLERLRLIADNISHKYLPKCSQDIVCEPDSYFTNTLVSSYDIPMEESCEELTSLNRKYRNIYLQKVSGFYYEDGEENGNNQNGGNNSSNGNGSQQNQGNNGGDNNQQNNQNQDNGNNNNQNENNNTKGEDRVNKLKDRINKIIDSINEFFERNGAKKKNLKFVEDNRENLKGKNYNGITINIMPYLQEGALTRLTKCVQAATGFNPEELKTLSAQQIQQKILGPIGITDVKTDHLEEAISTAMKVGKRKLEEVGVGNDELKSKVPSMLDFVAYYYTNFTRDLSGLKDTGLNGLTNLFKNGDQPKNNNNGEKDRTSENLNIIETTLTMCINGARNAAKDKANDYLKRLGELATGKTPSVNDNEQGNNGGDGNQQNGQNGSNQNGGNNSSNGNGNQQNQGNNGGNNN